MLNRIAPPPLFFNPIIDNIEYNTEVLNNNIPLYSITDFSKSVCGIEIIFGGGKITETKNGASYFSTNLLKAGTNQHSSSDINNFLELRGAFIQFQNGLDYNSFSLYCLSNKLEETLIFFFQLFNESNFPEEKVKQLAKKKVQELEINKQKSSYWSSKLLKELLFGKHPYGQLLTNNDIASISSSDLNSHWDRFSKQNIQFITAAGNFNKEKLKKVIESYFDKQEANTIPSRETHHLSNKREIQKKTLDNSNQSSLKIGFETISIHSKNYPAVSLGNTILGGYFGSRLMQTIREDKGLTYGIGSSIHHLKQSSFVQISADVKFGSGCKVIELIKLELEKLCNNKITEDELVKVKHYLIGEYNSNSQTIFEKINKVKFLKIQNLPDAYFSNHYKSIISSTSINIQEAIESQYNSNRFKIALVE